MSEINNKPKPMERKKLEKVTTGKMKEKTAIEKFVSSYLSKDIDNIKEYVVYDVLLPTFKRTLYDVITTGADILIYGEKRHNNKKSNSSYVAYSASYKDRFDDDDRPSRSNRSSSSSNKKSCGTDNVIFDRKSDAQNVLARMDEIVREFNVVRVADFYDLVDMTCEYTYQKYGWDSVQEAEIVPVREGYIIKFPRASLIIKDR